MKKIAVKQAASGQFQLQVQITVALKFLMFNALSHFRKQAERMERIAKNRKTYRYKFLDLNLSQNI